MNFFKAILIPVFLFFVQSISAQKNNAIKVTADKNKILIGEPLLLTIEARLLPESVFSFSNIDSLEHFELLDKPVIDSASSATGRTIKGVYKITSFDSGHWVIPAFVLSPGVQSDTIPVDVVFSAFDLNQDYHGIKDILDVTVTKKKFEWWWYAAGAVLLLALLVWLIRRKKPQSVVAPAVKQTVHPYQDAMVQLQLLQQQNPETKEYYSRLTNIFRVYIFQKKGILSLQKTTDDMVAQLKSLSMDKQQFSTLSQSLRMSDFVKFAKYIPGGEEDKNCFREIKNAIMTIEKSETNSPSQGGSWREV
jgi:hypothetical protein